MPVPWDTTSIARLRTQQLILLVRLFEQRTVLGAARACYISQPAASKLLQQLERTVGAELFVRHARGIDPTPYGEIMVRHARDALTELGHAYDEISSFKHGLSGHVALGTVVTSATDLIPEAVARLKSRSPQVLLSVEMEFSEVLIRRLREGVLDIVVARVHNIRHLPELTFHPIGEAQHVMVARSGHVLAKQVELTWADLEHRTWVMPPSGNVLRERVEQLFLEQNLVFPRDVVETASLPVAASLLHASDMVAPLPQSAIEPYCAAGMLAVLPIELDIVLGPAGIVTMRDRPLSPSAQAMLTELTNASKHRGAEPERQLPPVGLEN